MKRLLSQIVCATAGLWIASLVVPGVVVRTYPQSNFFGLPLSQLWAIFLVLGLILGLLNFFLKPLLKTLSLPLEIITLGLFSIVINVAMIWILDIIFDELHIPLILPLLYVTLIVWGVSTIINFFIKEKKK